jgi:Ca2+-binding EF-hand superfamily protein
LKNAYVLLFVCNNLTFEVFIVDKNEIIKLKQLFMQGANEDGLITLEQLDEILMLLPSTKNNPELRNLYIRVCILY